MGQTDAGKDYDLETGRMLVEEGYAALEKLVNETDLNLKHVIRIGYNFGLVESTCLSNNALWSGLKFTHPKEGKVYNNSYGTLKR